MDKAAFRELLAADVATAMGVVTAADASAALAQFWKTQVSCVLDAVPAAERARVEAEVERVVSEAGGDTRTAVLRRGVNRELPASMAPEASHELSEAGAQLRAPLRSMDKKRYVGFMPLGQGGMGVVYLALDSELNRRVAFKMIRSGVTDPLADESGPVSDEMVVRFMQEAVVTGGLEHPGIVPVYELGITPSGAPYYTMRLVRGERTLDDAIREAENLEDRLALLEPFLKVGDAVGYAHSRGVIHRDLKPANIALGHFGEVVVLDWGLAKMHQRPDLAGSRWQSRLDELREVTDLHTLTSALGTPGYMAPEAAFGELDKIDARTDVYSLGSILHRILTGKFPFAFGTFSEFVAQLAKGVTEVEGAPQGLARITMRALAVRREDRFQSVGELTDAVRAWQRESAIEREIDALQVEADASFQAADGQMGDELLRRLDATMALAARILDLQPDHASAGALRDEARAMRARAIAEGESAARRRLMKRVGVVGLLAATAATVAFAVLLNARRAEAESARARAEDLAAFMLNDLHEGLVPVGRTDLLASVARKSLDYYTNLPTEDVTDDTRRARGMILGRIGEVLQDTGDLQGAERSCLESLRIFESLDEPYELSTALNRLGDVQQEISQLEAALASYRRSVDIRRGLEDKSHLARSLDRTADVLLRMGNEPEARRIYNEELALRRALVLKDPGNWQWRQVLASSIETQGDLAIRAGNDKKGRAHYEESLLIRRRLLADAPSIAKARADLASTLFRVAHCQGLDGEKEKERASYIETLAIYRGLAQSDPARAAHQRHLAMTLERLAMHDEALTVKRALAARDAQNARAQHDLAVTLLGIGNRARGAKDYKGAMEHYQEALEIARRLVAFDKSTMEWQDDLSDLLYVIGLTQLATKQADAARASFEESVRIMERLVEVDPKNAEWQQNLALSLGKLGRFEDSIAIRRELLRRQPNDPRRKQELAWGLARLGEAKKDVRYFEEALAIRHTLTETDFYRRELAFCLYMVGSLYEKKKNYRKALPAVREAEQVHRTAKGYEKERFFWAEAYLRVSYDAACVAAVAGRDSEALALLAENLAWCRANLDEKRLAAHLEHVSTNDPDLKELRKSADFAALFR